MAQLRAVESERQNALNEFRQREQSTQTRLEILEQDEGRMTGLIDDLERRRLEEERRRAAATTAPTAPASNSRR